MQGRLIIVFSASLLDVYSSRLSTSSRIFRQAYYYSIFEALNDLTMCDTLFLVLFHGFVVWTSFEHDSVDFLSCCAA